MDQWIAFGKLFVNALGELWFHPFYTISLILAFALYWRQVKFERKCFGIRLHSAWNEAGKAILTGLVTGLMASVLFVALGLVIRPTDLFWIWGITLVLSLIRVRYLCMAYALGVVAVLHALSGFVFTTTGYNNLVLQSLQQIHIPSLLALVGLLHLMEAFLVRKQGSSSATPVFYEGKRGKVVGGYMLQRFWPVPIFVWVPMSSGTFSLPMDQLLISSGWPWISGEILVQSLALALFPAMIGYTEKTISSSPEEQSKNASGLLLGYSLIVIAFAVLSEFIPAVTLVGAVLATVLHEIMVAYSETKDDRRKPLYVHDEHGLKILAVIPRSPAEEMGIQSGEIIVKANGMLTRNKEDLHKALQRNPAYCKLELLNRSGQIKFANRSIYLGEHHQLGIILAPDQKARFAIKHEANGWFGSWKRDRKNSNAKTEQPPTVSA